MQNRITLLRLFVIAVLAAGCSRAWAQINITGVTGAHDPSTLQQYASNGYIYFATGAGLPSRTSTNMTRWSNGPAVFSTAPAWTATAVPGAGNNFWAPDIAYFGGVYHLYYSVSTFGSQVSAIGMATNTTLNPSSPNYQWVDQGPVIESTTGSAYNTIDPSILVKTDGTVWMTFGSYWNGIYETQLNPTNGKLLTGNPTRLAYNSQIEASYLYQHDNFYYLFVNWGMCCQGINSTYNIRVGRSTSVNGPFLDENGVSLVNGGGSLLLGTQGRYIGPGQTGIFVDSTNQDWLSYHYYDGNNNGAPTYELEHLNWDASGWPTLNSVPEPGMMVAVLALVPLLRRKKRTAGSSTHRRLALHSRRT